MRCCLQDAFGINRTMTIIILTHTCMIIIRGMVKHAVSVLAISIRQLKNKYKQIKVTLYLNDPLSFSLFFLILSSLPE